MKKKKKKKVAQTLEVAQTSNVAQLIEPKKEQTIKAIETKYKGYKFRSRLEARWAVFFDSAQIPWEYEKEGYTLRTGECYLPDFYLPEQNIFVEVKGEMPNDDYMRKLAQFGAEIEKSVLVLNGIFEMNQEYSLFCFNEPNGKIPELEWRSTQISLHPFFEGLWFYGGKGSCFENTCLVNLNRKILNHFLDIPTDYLSYKTKEAMLETTKKSIDAMKQARFEFNERSEEVN